MPKLRPRKRGRGAGQHAAADDLALEHVDGGKEGRGAPCSACGTSSFPNGKQPLPQRRL
jgi:hypothetical protein